VSLQVEIDVDLGDFSLAATFTVERGETVALVGSNGAGKSTVLRAIAGLEPVDRGLIAFDGTVWDDPSTGTFVAPERRRVGVVFQQYLLFDHLSALDNVAFGLRARGVATGEARRTAVDLLAAFEISGVAAQKPATLSGGQAQRVALARALAIKPDVILLDEPLAALDVAARGAVRRDLVARLDQTDAARIVVTHDPVDAYALADRVIVLEHGGVTQSGTMSDLASAPRTSYVAELLGTNLIRGVLRGDLLVTAVGADLVVGAHDLADGEALASVRPQAISLHRERPEGSPRNVWRAEILNIDHSVDRIRVRLGSPFGLVAEVTPSGLAVLERRVGDDVWVSVKASEVNLSAM
jgi:molybdate transport system ATP-binding protein